ncbi:MAG: ATP-dependent DNA helicase, partial [Phycicoccus sp.]
LDSRMMTARYAGFLQSSLPPFWPTADREMVLAALARLDDAAPPPLPVAEPTARGLGGSAPASAKVLVDADAAPTGEQAARRGSPEEVQPESAPAPASESSPSRTGPAASAPAGSWTGEADDELRDGVELGLTVEELAESLELSEDVVADRLETLGMQAGQGPTLRFE